MKRLLDTWDRNGSTSGLTPWRIYDDDDDDDDDDGDDDDDDDGDDDDGDDDDDDKEEELCGIIAEELFDFARRNLLFGVRKYKYGWANFDWEIEIWR